MSTESVVDFNGDNLTEIFKGSSKELYLPVNVHFPVNECKKYIQHNPQNRTRLSSFSSLVVFICLTPYP